MVQRNCVSVLEAAHRFGVPMVGRGRGGFLVVTSGAAWAGGAAMAAYGATKAFDLILAEALWAEWQPSGVDVLALVLGKTDTPALRRLLDAAGHPYGELASPDDVARTALDHLADGPTWIYGSADPAGASPLGASPPHRRPGAQQSRPSRGTRQITRQLPGDDRPVLPRPLRLQGGPRVAGPGPVPRLWPAGRSPAATTRRTNGTRIAVTPGRGVLPRHSGPLPPAPRPCPAARCRPRRRRTRRIPERDLGR